MAIGIRKLFLCNLLLESLHSHSSPRCRRDFFSDMQGRHRISSGAGFVWCAHSGQSNEYHTQRAYSRHLNIYLYSRFFLQSTRNLLKEYTSQTEQMCLLLQFFSPLVSRIICCWHKCDNNNWRWLCVSKSSKTLTKAAMDMTKNC